MYSNFQSINHLQLERFRRWHSSIIDRRNRIPAAVRHRHLTNEEERNIIAALLNRLQQDPLAAASVLLISLMVSVELIPPVKCVQV